MLPGWFGFGSGLRRRCEEHGEEVIGEMVAHWPFFAHLLDDVEAMLARTDLEIAAHYDALARRCAARACASPSAGEYALTVEHVLRLRGSTRLLDGDPTLQRAITLRNPYVDPMHLMQVDLLQRWRATARAGRRRCSARCAPPSAASRRACRRPADGGAARQHSGTLTARPPCEVSL